MTIMASGMLSKIDVRWAARASASAALAVALTRDAAQKLTAPRHADADQGENRGSHPIRGR